MNNSLSDRMKLYEQKYSLPPNIPVIIRIDGRAFHTFTRGMKKPFDLTFIDMMNEIGIKLCEGIQNCRMSYLQSDEISLLVLNRPESDTWFGNEIQKMCSVSASVASSVATKFMSKYIPDSFYDIDRIISFDSRAFIIPKDDVVNYFIWRQKDWERNSLQMYTRYYYSQKEMENKKREDMHEMLHDIELNWNDLEVMIKRGRCIIKEETQIEINNPHFSGTVTRNIWEVDTEIPIFTEDREYITKRL